MATVQLTEDTFDEVAQREGIVLIDFWASWCGPCVRFAPVFEQASDRHPDITFGKVDTEAQPALSARFEVRSIPTIMVVRDGVIVYAEPGALPEQALEDIIGQVRALDMDEIRAKISKG